MFGTYPYPWWQYGASAWPVTAPRGMRRAAADAVRQTKQNMTRDNNNKLRAVFLAALMFLWLFAGTVAFAGGAAAQPTEQVEAQDLDGTEFFQGQEIDVNFTNVDDGDIDPEENDTIQIREVTDRTDGEPSSSTVSTGVTRTLNEEENATFDTEDLPTGDFVVRIDNGSSTGFLNTSNQFQQGTLSSIANDENATPSEFGIVTQSLATDFDDGDDGQEVRAGNSIEFQFTSNERSSFDVNISEADGDLDNEEILAIFDSGEDNITDRIEIEDSNVDDDDEEVRVTFTDNDFDADVTIGNDTVDIDSGEYELVFEVFDSTAESTAALTVLEEEDEDGSFDQGTFSTTRGDVLQISGEIEGNNDFVNVTIGDEDDQGFETNVTIEPNDDNEFTLLVNTRIAGQEDVGSITDFSDDSDIEDFVSDDNAYGTLEDQGEIESAFVHANTDAVLAAGNYDLDMQADANEDVDNADRGEFDVASMDLTERATVSLDLWRADEDLDPDDFEDLEELEAAIEDGAATQTDTLAVEDEGTTADLLIHQIGVSGVQGEGTTANELLNATDSNGTVSIEYEQLDPAANREPLELNYTQTNFDNFELFVDGENEFVYAVADPADLSFDNDRVNDQGIDDLDLSEEFEVRYNVSANYLNQFELDDPFEVGADEDDEIVSANVDLEERELEFDTIDDEIILPATDDAELSGNTNVAPATEFDIRVQGSGDTAFLRTADDVAVGEDGTFSGVVDVSDIEQGVEFEATVRNQGFEDDAETDGIIGEIDGPVFTVDDLEPQEAEVEQGTEIDVSATITNDGDETGTQDVSLTINGDVLLTEEDVELDEGDDTVVEFEGVDTSDLPEGTYEHGIETEDDSATGTLTITVEDEEPPADDEEPPADDEEPPADDDEEPPEDPDDQAGFGAVIALIALLGAALLAARRNAQN